MYADRYAGGHRFSPGGLAVAIGINAVVISALMFAAPHMGVRPPADEPLETYRVPIDPPPPLEDVAKPQPRSAPSQPRVEAPLPPVPIPPTSSWTVDPGPPVFFDPFATEAGSGSGTGTAKTTEPAAPVIVAPSIDPRYAADFQPLYPASEQRAGASGRVTVRVLIGIDGRVKQVERVSATSDAFYRATEQQALRRWRFRPGTRDGVAQEVWRTMSVTFVLSD